MDFTNQTNPSQSCEADLKLRLFEAALHFTVLGQHLERPSQKKIVVLNTHHFWEVIKGKWDTVCIYI